MRMALVIDDELDICLMITKHLQNMHFQTHYARTVKDAQEKMAIPPYDLMMIDLNLPDGSGFDVMQNIRDLKLKSKIIVISAHDSEYDRALAMGASLFLTKPFTTRTINEALKTLNLMPN